MMESVEKLRQDARRSLKVAEQVLIMTYPVVEDPRLMLAVAGDIYSALAGIISAFLVSEGVGKEDFADFGAGLAAFRRLAKGRGMSDDDIEVVECIRRIVRKHKESPVEFARKGNFVICDDGYDCTVISVDDMKKYLFRARLFVDKVELLLKDVASRENE